MIVRTGLAALAICSVLAITGCANTPLPSSPDPQLLGTWHLILATDRGATVASGAEDITLTIGDSTHTGGASPCSPYRASITGGLGAVFIEAVLRQRGADCADAALLRVDDQYIAALSATTVASIDDGILVLSSPHSSLVYLKPAPSSTGTLQNTRWDLVLPPDLREKTDVRLTFGNAHQLTITTSCGATVARYVLVEDIIMLQGLATTRVGAHECTAIDRSAAAIVTGELTADVSSATIAGGATLILINRANEEPLLWRAAG